MPSSDRSAPQPPGFERFRFVTVVMDGEVAVVTMGHPVDDTFLAQSHPMHTELRDIWPVLAADPVVKAVVLTGTDQIFFAGPPLDETEALLTANLANGAKMMFEAREICLAMLDFRKPTVAAINGLANSMGAQMALLCDFAVGASTMRFQDSHIRLGLPAGDGGTLVWPLLVGMAKARDILLRSRPVDAAEAKDLGLIASIAELPELLPEARRLAARLARLPSFAYGSTKLALNQWFRTLGMASFDLSLGLELAAFSGEEFRGAINQARRKTDAR